MIKYIILLETGLGNQIMSYCLWHHLVYQQKQKAILYCKKDVGLNNIFKNTMPMMYSKWYIDGCIFFEKVLNRLEKILCKVELVKYFPVKVVRFPYWENYHFIKDIEDLNYIFRFPQLDGKNQEIANFMRKTNSVSIHVRRGDYQKVLFWRVLLGDICEKEYYDKAISRVEELVENPVYFIFSDEIEWVKQNLKIKDGIYIDWNYGMDSYKDMYLISCCKCNICANSTFSLMSTWFNNNPNPIRIVPTKWLNQHDDLLFAKYIPDDNWIPIDNKRPTISIFVKSKLSRTELNYILSQTYSDFELFLIKNNTAVLIDDRIKQDSEPTGRFILKVQDPICFRKKNYLRYWIEERLSKKTV